MSNLEKASLGDKKKKEKKQKNLKEGALSYAEGQIDDDDWMYRRISGRIVDRDLSSLTQERMIDIVAWLYKMNPIGRRIIEMTKDFVIGDGLKFQAKDPDVHRWLRKFWNDSTNSWEMKQFTRVLELGLFGEQCYPVFVNKIDGFVKMGYIDPKVITRVVTDAENCEIVQKIVTKIPKTYEVIKLKPVAEFPGEYRQGEAFFFAINKETSATRGTSDLLPIIDWLDMYEQIHFDRAERFKIMNAYLWEYIWEGLSQKEIDEKMSKIPTPKPGSNLAHNEKVKINALAPNLESNDASKEVQMFRNNILSGAGMPPPWYASGEGVTRATALEMSTPTFKMFKSRQQFVKSMITEIFNFVIDQAILKKTLPVDVDRAFVISLPKLIDKDLAEITQSFSAFLNSLPTVVAEGFLSRERAREIVRFLVGQMGVEVVPEEEDNLFEAEGRADILKEINRIQRYLKGKEK